MLKIKDDVDLKVLEKYGFVDNDGSTISFIPNKENEDLKIDIVGSDNNSIYLGSGFMLYSNYDKDLEIVADTLYDLIKDGLVEKVE